MSSVPDFTDAEQWAAETTLKQRWPEQAPANQLADVEIRMHAQDPERSAGPAVCSKHSKTIFVSIHVADRTCRNPIYYRGFQQYGTGKTDYDDITDCVATVLPVHADKETRDREQSA